MNARPVRTRPGLTAQVESLTVGAPPAHSQTHAVTDSQTHAVPESQTPVPARPVPAGSGPRWRRLVRKEARLRGDQAEALARLRRQITAARTDRSEVITDNTLIRVAVDLLLARADDLTGDTEDALRTALGLPPLD